MTMTREARLYIAATVIAGAVLLVGLRAWWPAPSINPAFWIPLLAGVALVPVAGYCPICLARYVAVNMGSSVMFAMLLLLPPGFAAIGSAAGIAVLYTLQRWPASLVAFNTMQTAITVGLAGAVYWSLAPSAPADHFGLTHAGAALMAVGTFFVINSVVVTAGAVLLLRTEFSSYWRSTFGRTAIPYLSTLLLGVLAAVTFIHAPLLTPVLALPVVAVYRALRNESVVLRQTQATIELLADTIDRRDPYTYAHSQRVASLTERIAARLRLSPDDQSSVARAARVHDVGKLGIPDALLRKSGGLSAPELEQVRKHAAIGAEIVGRLPEYRQSKDFILYHHERYDGSGYFGLVGEHIPLGARIIAVADALDAMTSDRPYRRAMADAEALSELERGRGGQFDPRVVQAVLDLLRDERQGVRGMLGDRAAQGSQGVATMA